MSVQTGTKGFVSLTNYKLQRRKCGAHQWGTRVFQEGRGRLGRH